jgi:hydroxymethylpyrimidine pyrophosphatase-like HAD family hydrolase
LKRAGPEPIRLAVVDVDGCLTPGEGQAWNWSALQGLRRLNREAQQGAAVPAVTLCTGRQEPYVEVLMQAIGAYLPGIYENGCGLYDPVSYRFFEHRSITARVRQALAAAKATLQRTVVAAGRGYSQPGKEASLSLYPLPGTSVEELHRAAVDALAGHDGLAGHDALFSIRASVSCVDVTPSGIDKGSGVRWLAEETGIPLAQMGGIGDSTSDLTFLRLVSRSAAPANATAEVKAAVHYVSPQEDGDGVLDILHRWCGRG